MRRHCARLGLAAAMLVASCQVSLAAGSGMPWEAPLQRILESIEGPVAKVVAVVTIILTGLSLATLLDSAPAQVVSGALLMALFVPFCALFGWFTLRRPRRPPPSDPPPA